MTVPVVFRAAAVVVIIIASTAAVADPHGTAVLRALDKVTARTSLLEVPVGTTVGFGNLQITAHACDKRPPEEPPEQAAFLVIQETRAEGGTRDLFTGWMFASSPGLSALEHPIYDVWVLDCANSLASSSANGALIAPE